MRWLRRLDAVSAWALLWGVVVLVAGPAWAWEGAVLAIVIGGLGSAVRPIRVRWRPFSGWAGLALSRSLQPGDRAWHVRSQQADLVLVTGRHGVRLVIARSDLDRDEGISVRRTRVLVLPAPGPVRPF
ncbi:MAG: hypothetical protein WEG40_00485 [Candidatus Rokuibacteriota bacterium]